MLAALSEKFKALGYPAHLPGGTDESADPALRELLKAGGGGGVCLDERDAAVGVGSGRGAEAATRDLFHWISALIAAYPR